MQSAFELSGRHEVQAVVLTLIPTEKCVGKSKGEKKKRKNNLLRVLQTPKLLSS